MKEVWIWSWYHPLLPDDKLEPAQQNFLESLANTYRDPNREIVLVEDSSFFSTRGKKQIGRNH